MNDEFIKVNAFSHLDAKCGLFNISLPPLLYFFFLINVFSGSGLRAGHKLLIQML